jgi:hypothetical protein
MELTLTQSSALYLVHHRPSRNLLAFLRPKRSAGNMGLPDPARRTFAAAQMTRRFQAAGK